MKKLFTIILSVLSVFVLFSTSAFAAAPFVQDAPTVPVDVAIQGRQKVTDYLLAKIDHVTVSYVGNSIAGPAWNDQYLERSTLKYYGYVHDGLFSELSDAMAGITFGGDVIATPDGYYDVQARVSYFGVDNKKMLSGNGYLDIWRNQDGNLVTGEFRPYVSIESYINIKKPGYISAAKWVGHNGRSLELGVSYDGINSTISLPSGNLDNGYLLISNDQGRATGWDLATGNTLTAERVFAALGQSQSSDVEVLRDPAVINAGNTTFYSDGNQVKGRFPMRELIVTEGSGDVWYQINFKVPVWGSAEGVAPSRMFLKPIHLPDNYSGLVEGLEHELVFKSGAFQLIVPRGIYHIRTEFQGVSDWDENTDGYYGGPIVFGKGNN